MEINLARQRATWLADWRAFCVSYLAMILTEPSYGISNHNRGCFIGWHRGTISNEVCEINLICIVIGMVGKTTSSGGLVMALSGFDYYKRGLVLMLMVAGLCLLLEHLQLRVLGRSQWIYRVR